MTLYVVGTPIGNADDVTLRALKILKEVDFVAAEDTRKTGSFLARHGLKKKLLSHHEHNERESAEGIVKLLREGKKVALVTNAGTPLISDPGYTLVRRVLEEGLEVVPIPGPSSITCGISVSGLPTHEFHFLGFPPKKEKALKDALLGAKELGGTLIYFESAQRLARLLETAHTVLGDRRAAVARELTKVHEEVIRGTLRELAQQFSGKPPKGEIVVLIEGITRAT